MPDMNKEDLQKLILEAISRINNGISKTLTARKSSEIPPQDTRHLTDTRTRVSTLLEYSLSYELNHLLVERGTHHSVSNVLWNVFPDLVLRDSAFDNVMGLEVKALHTAAEEKSANLSTPLSLIRKGKDFIVILAWGWCRSQEGVIDITYPHIHDVGMFDAWLIAKMRDSTWLINSNGRVKGIDISTPVINSDMHSVKAEEGNLGKLMRIHMSDETSEHMPSFEEMLQEAEAYTEFKNRILMLGLNETIKDISEKAQCVLSIPEDIQSPPEIATVIGSADRLLGKIHYVTGTKRSNVSWETVIESLDDNDVIIQLGNKLDWKVIKKTEDWFIVSFGKKPDIELEKIHQAILVG